MDARGRAKQRAVAEDPESPPKRRRQRAEGRAPGAARATTRATAAPPPGRQTAPAAATTPRPAGERHGEHVCQVEEVSVREIAAKTDGACFMSRNQRLATNGTPKATRWG
jgi:hypothetical protein